VVSFFLWVCVRLIRYGFCWVEFLLSIGLALLAWQTKSNAAIVLPLAPVAWLFAILRRRWQWIAWAVAGLGIVALLGFSFTRDDAAFYYRSSSMQEAVRVMDEKAVLGEWVLQVDVQAPITPGWMPAFFQPVPLEGISRNFDLPVTLGVWMWASRPVTAIAPKVTTQGHEYKQSVQLSEEPVFYTVEARVDPDLARMWVSFDPLPQGNEDVVVYYDGLVLAEGIRPLDQPPVYADELAASGTWGGEPFENLLRNGSAEVAGLRVKAPIDELGAMFLPDHIRPSFILASILDREGAGWYYQIAMDRVLTTFWGYFGWSHIPLAYPWIYGFLNILGLVGIIGAVISLIRNWRTAPWGIVFFLALAVGLMAVATLMRGVIYLAYQNMFFPVARYLMPVVVPILLVLNTGWLVIWQWLKAGIQRLQGKGQPVQRGEISWISYSIFTLLWIVLDVAALVTVFQYYQGIPVLR
jgi:hypothetical protein